MIGRLNSLASINQTVVQNGIANPLSKDGLGWKPDVSLFGWVAERSTFKFSAKVDASRVRFIADMFCKSVTIR